MSTYFSDFLGSLFWGFTILYLTIFVIYGLTSFRDFFKYRPPRPSRRYSLSDE